MNEGQLILSPSELERVVWQLERFGWYGGLFERFRGRVDELIGRSPGIPVVKGRAFFESCPVDHARLTFDPFAPRSHLCPKCGRDWVGEEFDLSWVRQFQDWLGKRLVEAGIVYRVLAAQGQVEEGYARLVRDSLVHFVEHYREYPLANNLLGPTRLFQSTYLEAFWLVDMVAAYDLTSSSEVYSSADHSGIRGLLYESCSVVMSFDEGESNRQAFNNAGMGAVALLYQDAELLEHVLAGPHGFAFHMRESLLEDGIWYEGETYHFATLDHSLNLAEMARHRGIDLYRGESGYGSLRPMFDGPLKVMLPDLTFPSRKDSWFGRGIGYHREVYELGFARYGDERYGGLLAHAYATGTDRSDLAWRSFLYLDPELPQVNVAGPARVEEHARAQAEGQTDTRDVQSRGVLSLSDLRPQASESMPGTGIAILRRDDGSVYAGLEYGHYGGGHGHPDRLHLTLYANGVHWLLDPGTGWYHVPELGWYRSTLAHNTVTIDAANQNPTEGRLTAFGEAGGYQAVQAVVDGAYPGTQLRRTLLLGDGFLLDIFDVQAEAGESHMIDLSFHTAAHTDSVVTRPLTEDERGELGNRQGYEFLKDVSELSREQLDFTFRSQGKTMRSIPLGAVRRFAARAPGVPLREDAPFTTVISRREGERVTFATLWTWGAAAGEARFSELEGGEYLVELDQRRHRILVDDGDGIAVASAVTADPMPTIDRVAWFNRREFNLGAVTLRADRHLEQAALSRSGGAWLADLRGGFGEVKLAGLDHRPVEGLLEGAVAQVHESELLLKQAPGAHAWLNSPEELKVFAGCSTTVLINTAFYDSEPLAPELELPTAWRLSSLHHIRSGTWEAVIEVPGTPASADGEFGVKLGSKSFEFPYRLLAPIETSWRVDGRGGSPAVTLDVTDVRGQGGSLRAELGAPWPLGKLESSELELPPAGQTSVSLPLPGRPPALDRSTAGEYCNYTGNNNSLPELPGLTGCAGDLRFCAQLSVEGFDGRSHANLPLYWIRPEHAEEAVQIISLGRKDQALWADRHWGGPADASATAHLTWSGEGIRLRCSVTDDHIVSDANEDDLYENDSIQVYFDFRGTHHSDSNFTPGVAAYVLAPDAGLSRVRIREIAGNREISNRGARAGWFTAEGVSASVRTAGGGYDLDIFFPYSSLGVEPLTPGRVVGFDLSLSDNDGTWYRNTQLLWSGSRGRRCYIRGSYHDPRDFGWLIFAE